MQIDSHMIFVPGFDEIAIQNLHACPSEKSIISHYPHDSKSNSLDVETVPVLCNSTFDSEGMVTFQAIPQMPPKDGRPRPIPFLAAGFLFAPGSLVYDVPFDPTLEMLFTGEEILYSARTWTNGWNFFSPLQNICFHHYTRNGESKFWEDIPNYRGLQKKNLRRVIRLLGLDGITPGPLDYKYGMGEDRSLSSFLNLAGIHPSIRETTTAERFC